MTMMLKTLPCPVCHQPGEVEVPFEEGAAYMIGVLRIQDAMPTTPANIREQLITGLHPACTHPSGCLCPPVCGACGLPTGDGVKANNACEACADHVYECMGVGGEPA